MKLSDMQEKGKENVGRDSTVLEQSLVVYSAYSALIKVHTCCAGLAAGFAWGVAACWDDGILPAKAAQVFGFSGDNKEDKSINT